jgi:hypothetical protein
LRSSPAHHVRAKALVTVEKSLFSPADKKRYWLIMVEVECLTALGVLIGTRGRLGLKPPSEGAVARSSTQ